MRVNDRQEGRSKKVQLWEVAILFFVVAALAALAPSRGWTEVEKDFYRMGEGQAWRLKAPDLNAVPEVGAMPYPLPSRRQIIDADKGASCLLCHRLPYPTASRSTKKSEGEFLTSIQTTPPGGWRLLVGPEDSVIRKAGAWTPDGKRFLYAVQVSEEDWDLWIVGADGHNQQPLVSGPGVQMAADCSPDGKAIVFHSNLLGNYDIWMMDLASRRLSQITIDLEDETRPKWSPDGTKIVFQASRGENVDLWVMDLAYHTLTELTRDPARDEEPAFSPQGDRILFVSDRLGNKDLFLMNADGSGQKPLTNTPDAEMNPRWSPDGKRIIFTRASIYLHNL